MPRLTRAQGGVLHTQRHAARIHASNAADEVLREFYSPFSCQQEVLLSSWSNKGVTKDGRPYSVRTLWTPTRNIKEAPELIYHLRTATRGEVREQMQRKGWVKTMSLDDANIPDLFDDRSLRLEPRARNWRFVTYFNIAKDLIPAGAKTYRKFVDPAASQSEARRFLEFLVK